jgi:microcystin-dependent protein
MCDGAAVNRVTYAALFAAIGTIWGVGDGVNTFNVPDLRGRATIGAGTGSGLSLRAVGTQNIGVETEVIAAANLPPHAHSVTGMTGGESANHTHYDAGHAHGTSFTNQSGQGTWAQGANSSTYPGYDSTGIGYASLSTESTVHTHSFTTTSGNGPGTSTAINVMQPSAVLNKIIKT